MRTINKRDVGKQLAALLDEKEPLDEDIGILAESGEIAGVVITKDAYQFFLRMVEQKEDELDIQVVKEFELSGEKNL